MEKLVKYLRKQLKKERRARKPRTKTSITGTQIEPVNTVENEMQTDLADTMETGIQTNLITTIEAEI